MSAGAVILALFVIWLFSRDSAEPSPSRPRRRRKRRTTSTRRRTTRRRTR